jgi:cephalosporin-C deacetylase
MLFDLPLDQLKTYLPDRNEPTDFDQFWQSTLSETRHFPLKATFEPVDYGLKAQDSFDVTFNGFGGQPVKGWFLLPHQHETPLPCVVEFIGYGGGRGFPTDWLLWSSVGYAHLVMDTRGQGSDWQKGDTADIYSGGGNPNVPGFVTQGILSPQDYYYRRLFTDGIRAIEAVRNHPAVDVNKIAVTGVSQGGGISLAVAGLEPAVKIAMPEVPFLSHVRRATELVDTHPYQEIAKYCNIHRNHVEKVFQTLSYFDGVNFAVRAKATALFSVGLMDMVCPPSCVFASYNHYAGEKDIRIYPYNGHEGGADFHSLEKIRFINSIWR